MIPLGTRRELDSARSATLRAHHRLHACTAAIELHPLLLQLLRSFAPALHVAHDITQHLALTIVAADAVFVDAIADREATAWPCGECRSSWTLVSGEFGKVGAQLHQLRRLLRLITKRQDGLVLRSKITRDDV